MSPQPENPQHDPRQYDAQHEGANDADPQAQGGDPYADPQGEGPYADEPSGPPYRAIAMVLLSAVVLAVGVGLVQLFGGDDDEVVTADDQGTSQVEQNGQVGADGQPLQPGQIAADGQVVGAPADPNAPAAGRPGAPAPEQGEVPAGSVPVANTVPVQVYNNSTVTGLANRTGERLRESGFAVGAVESLPSNRGVVSESTAFYGTAPGEREAAEAVAAQLGIVAKPRPADLPAQGPGVVVIVTQDLER